MSSSKNELNTTFQQPVSVDDYYAKVRQMNSDLQKQIESFGKQHFADSPADFVFASLYSKVYIEYQPVDISANDPSSTNRFSESYAELVAKRMQNELGNLPYNMRQFYNVCRNLKPYIPQIVEVMRYYAIENKKTGEISYPTFSLCCRKINLKDYSNKKSNCPIPDVNFIFELANPVNNITEKFVMTKEQGPLRIVNRRDTFYVRYDAKYATQRLVQYECINDKYKNVANPLLSCPTSCKFQPIEQDSCSEQIVDCKQKFADKQIVQKLYLYYHLEYYHGRQLDCDLISEKEKDTLNVLITLVELILSHLKGSNCIYKSLKCLLPLQQGCCTSQMFKNITKDFYTRIQEQLDDDREENKLLDELLSDLDQWIKLVIM